MWKTMFTLMKNNTGAVAPWEARPAKKGAYQAGQVLTVSGGMLAPITTLSTKTPEFLCMQSKTVEEAGDSLNVVAIDKDTVYEADLIDNASGLNLGEKMAVAAGGLGVTTGAGTFFVLDWDGIEIGDRVRGRFI